MTPVEKILSRRKARKRWRDKHPEYNKQYRVKHYSVITEQDRKRGKKRYSEHPEQFQRWKENNRDKVREYNNKWRAKNPLSQRAHKKVHNALISGRLKKLPCSICGDERVDAHHPDYNKPLEVIWLCRKCHMKTYKMR